MAQISFFNVSIKGIAVTLGESKVSIDDEVDYFGGNMAQINGLKKVIGINVRYRASKNTTAADLCFNSAMKLIREMSVNLNDIDGIISVTQTPDYNMPGNAHVLHGKIGFCDSTFAIDVNSGCSGYIYGLYLAHLMLSGGSKKILLVAGDTMSKAVNPGDKTEYPLFSDAGSATILEYEKDANQSYFVLHSEGEFVDLMYQPAGAYRNPSSEKSRTEILLNDGSMRSMEDFFMDGFKVFDSSLPKQIHLVSEIMEYAKKEHNEIDYVISHQSNSYLVNAVAKKSGFSPEACINTFSKYGNQSSASIPCAICDSLKNKSGKIILSAFGTGFSYGACLLDLNDPVLLFSNPSDGGDYE